MKIKGHQDGRTTACGKTDEPSSGLSPRMRARTYVVCPSFGRVGNGTDFYADFVRISRSFGLRAINTCLFGKPLCPLFELLILCALPFRAVVITTWPGFPYQYLVLPCFINQVRFALFALLLRLKRIEYSVLPIDRPLDQYAHRLSRGRLAKQRLYETRLLSHVSAFLCCGTEMATVYRTSYPSAHIIRLDMYDQVLPDTDAGAHKANDGVLRIAVSGNLSRMSLAARELPSLGGVQYIFTGPGGGDIAESGREDVMILGNVPDADLLQALSRADFGLIMYDDCWSPYFATVIAGKLTTYLLAGVPILCPARYRSMAEYVQRSGTGIVIEDYGDIRKLRTRSSPLDGINANVAKEAMRIKYGLHYKEAIMELQEFVLDRTP